MKNTDNTDRNGANKQNTHTNQTLRERSNWKGLVGMKISDTLPFFLKISKTLPPPPFFAAKHFLQEADKFGCLRLKVVYDCD